MSVEWKRLCLTTAGCHESRFRIIMFNEISNIQLIKSWTIGDGQFQDKPRSFISSWENGTPNAITISSEVAGIDPTYKFPRICDLSKNFTMYDQSKNNQISTRMRLDHQLIMEDENGKMMIELKGRCFNVTLALTKFEERCPWCSVSNDVTVIENQYAEDDQKFDFIRTFLTDDHWLFGAIIILAFVATISCIAFACLLKAFLQQKQIYSSKKSRFVGCSHNFAVIESPCTSENSSKYEIPWDQKYRILPRWTSIQSDETVSSPVDSSTSSSSQYSKTMLSVNEYVSPGILNSTHHENCR
ncbi:unnamed protein product [Dracunculus medinensis]|uniref:C2 domain-containing protein n=1 Tax=Dracunculus medinensis TaxID=318479 RepID=A0A158Q465_DRAME|nr:unnamed protein product [Dracunculus medinensis]